ncbi:MAG: DUF4352 domain-containing protein [Oscillospiraceae bacterium]|nr:DUF4352 domain-containing protein [Oscillospiraceae bacterium]
MGNVEKRSIKLMFIALFFIICVMFSSCGNTATNNNTAKTPDTPTGDMVQNETIAQNATEAPTSSKYQIGDTINQSDILVTVNGVRTTTNNGAVDVEAGFKYVYVDITIINNTKKDLISSSVMNYTLKDQNGRKLDFIVAINTNGSIDGTVIAGDKLTGEVVYKVPADLTIAILQIQTNILGKADQVELNF